MTQERREELRKWSAEKLMGFEHEVWWIPDSEDAPASQIFSVIEKMRKLGYKGAIYWNLEQFQAYFRCKDTLNEYYRNGSTLPEAVLEAAHAALEGR